MKKALAFILVIFCSIFITLPAMAQGFDEDVEDTPIDGGISLLIAAGIGLGAKKVHQARKNHK
jgi:hypothetical protein